MYNNQYHIWVWLCVCVCVNIMELGEIPGIKLKMSSTGELAAQPTCYISAFKLLCLNLKSCHSLACPGGKHKRLSAQAALEGAHLACHAC